MKKTVAVVALALLLAGCEGDVVSLYPLYEERNLVFERALLGSWEGDSTTWKFEASGDRAYRLMIRERSGDQAETTELEGHLLQLAGFLFLDFCALNYGDTGIPGHVFAKARIEGDRLELAFLADAWMKEKLVREKALPHLWAGEGRPFVVTAPTADLQYFFVRYATDEKAFGSDELVLRRKE